MVLRKGDNEEDCHELETDCHTGTTAQMNEQGELCEDRLLSQSHSMGNTMGIFSSLFGKTKPASKEPARSKVIRAMVPHVGEFDFHIHTSTDVYISGDLETNKTWEPFETEIFRRLCESDSFVLDIGANIGWYTKIASKLLGSNGSIWSFEPDKTNFSLLQKNLSLEEYEADINFSKSAVGDIRSEAKLYLSPTNLGDHHLFEDGEVRPHEEIYIDSLDNLLGSLPQLPTLLKSDTQGSEYKIIRGASQLFARGWRPDMIIEFWPYGLKNSGDDAMSLWRDIVSLGYGTYQVSEHNPGLFEVTEEHLNRMIGSYLSPEAGGFINLLCLPNGSKKIEIMKDLMAN